MKDALLRDTNNMELNEKPNGAGEGRKKKKSTVRNQSSLELKITTMGEFPVCRTIVRGSQLLRLGSARVPFQFPLREP